MLPQTFVALCFLLSVNSISVPVNSGPLPVSVHNVGVPIGKHPGDPQNTHPQYSYTYNVQDVTSGDSKTQHETRDGDVVRGGYSFIEPDGSRRIVEYTADGIHGFNAIVRKEHGMAVHQGAMMSGTSGYSASLPRITPATVGVATIKGPVAIQRHGHHEAHNLYQQRVMNVGVHPGQVSIHSGHVPTHQPHGYISVTNQQPPAVVPYTPRIINLPRPNLSFWPYTEAKVYYNHPNAIHPHASIPKSYPSMHNFPFNVMPQMMHHGPTPLHPIPTNPHPFNPHPVNPTQVSPHSMSPPHVVPPKTVTIGRYGYGYAPLVNPHQH